MPTRGPLTLPLVDPYAPPGSNVAIPRNATPVVAQPRTPTSYVPAPAPAPQTITMPSPPQAQPRVGVPAPVATPPPQTPPTSFSAPPPPAGAAGTYQYGSPNDPTTYTDPGKLLGLQLNQGMTPQQAADAVNRYFNLGIGSQAVVYAGKGPNGTDLISLANPNGYYSNNGGTWTWNARNPEGGSGAGGVGGGGNGLPTPTQYPDQSTNLLLNTVLQRLQQLQQPIQDPYGDLYAQQALSAVAKLGGQPYTDADSAALIAQFRDPLTQARDAAKQQEAEMLSRRGITPTSGVFASEMNKIDQQYQAGIAQGSNALGVKAVAQKQANQAEQLQILDSLVSMGRMSRQEATQRAQELLQDSAIPMDVDLQRLNALLAASGDNQINPSSIFGNIAQQQQLGLTQQQIANQQSAANAATWGQIIGALLGGLH